MVGAGSNKELFPQLQLPLDTASWEGFTLTSPYPVILENINEETRFRVSGLAKRHGAVSGISTLIGTLETPYGIIEAFSQQRQPVTESDICFLQSVANILALVLRQGRSEVNLMTENQKLKKELVRAQFMTPSGHFEWDRYEIKNRLIESRERERLRLAQDLHDAPIQDLYGMIYQLDDLRDALKDPEAEKILDECDQTLHKVVDSLRSICRELRPPSLSPFGLEVAIRDHVEKFVEQNPDIKVNLELMQDKQLLSDSLRLTLFRIYQQAIHNVSRHAQATEIHIRFHWDDEIIVLEVEDNGIGFETPDPWMGLVQDGHYGLLGIAERVESIGGKLEIVSALGNGTLIRAIVPHS
jgi:signal transduction histidine kinase